MDEKSSRQLKPSKRAWRLRSVGSYRQSVRQFLGTHKHSLLSSFLLVAMVILLFGIANRLQPPSTSTPPDGVTVMNYSTFIEQVKAGNVQAVTIQGNAISGYLIHPLAQNNAVATPTATSASNTTTDFAAWSRYVGAGYPSNGLGSSSPQIDPAHAIYTLLPAGGDASLAQLLLNNHVLVTTQPVAQPGAWVGIVWRFLPLLLLVIAFFVVMSPKKNAGSPNSAGMNERMRLLGKSRARRVGPEKEAPSPQPGLGRPATAIKPKNAPSATSRVSLEPAVTFADVAGIDEVRTELEEIVQFLRNPERFDRLGARIPRGALLVGPPGTGKTLLAKAVAGEAGVPFFSMSASEFVEMFVGVGASRVRDLFSQARQAAPCVIFLDEIDAVGRKRSMRVSGNDERDQTLNQLLVELDGFDGRKAVVVLAATNRVDILDKALLRPGRFDRNITVSLPDRVGRAAILKVHTRRNPLHEDVSLDRLSRMTTGMSGADLANLTNEAALTAARQDLEHITHNCFEEALVRVQLGALRPIVMSEADRRIIAYHEGGHALVAHHSPLADTVNRVTILPRGQSLGVTQFTTEEDRYNYSRETLMARIAVGLGGRAAEELTFGAERVTTGAENDLQVVTDLARRMVTRWGMSKQVGVVFADYQAASAGIGLNMRRIDLDDIRGNHRSLVADANGQLRLNGDDSLPGRELFAVNVAATRSAGSSVPLATLVDQEVQGILKEGYDKALAILAEHNDQLVKLADELMEREQLDRKQFEALFQ